MVTFKLIEEGIRYIVYWYFPEGNEENGHGVIIIDKEQETIDILELAPRDFSMRFLLMSRTKCVNQ